MAETVATRTTSASPFTGIEIFASSATMASTALSMPALIMIEFDPAATLRMPSLKIAWASTTEVVVPSPAVSFVLDETSRMSWAPMFSKRFSTSISLAMVTPSLMTVGEPNFFSRTTLRPRGPRVTLTAFASLSTPASRRRRASSVYLISFAAMSFGIDEGRVTIDDS